MKSNSSFKVLKCLIPLLVVLASACNRNVLFDGSKPIADNAWSYKDKKDNYVNIKDVKAGYKLSLNLRITNNYRYSNIFVLLHIYEPGRKMSTRRLEFKLADSKGDWLGSGSGTTYTYQIPFATDVKFPVKGVYNFQFEQNMREDPLRDVVDCGIRIESGN